MRLITLVALALVMSTSALPRTASENDLKRNQKKAQRRDGGDAQCSLSKVNEYSHIFHQAYTIHLALDKRVICSNFAQDGQANATEGQVPSLTSKNNFINFCLTVDLPLTNGQQLKGGSCNPTPMGVIPPSTNMPSSKFVTPANLDAVKANTPFEIKMAIKHLDTGYFVNPDTNFFAAPQQLNDQKDIIGHTHFVIEQLSSINTMTVSDPTNFAFFKGVNTPADENGQVSVNVTDGLPEGVYKLSSINTSANHAPVNVPIAERGVLDDQVYVGGRNALDLNSSH
jgi:hypothetical protein